MRDVQKERDLRNIEIKQVGVKGLTYPIKVFDKKSKSQFTVAKLTLSVNLPKEYRGTHMSRFIEVLNEEREGIAMWNVFNILKKLKERLNAESAHLEISFPYFIEKEAPVSRIKSMMKYDCKFIGSIDKEGKHLMVEVTVPIQTLCPCSKEISEKGAHNQRAYVKIKVKPRSPKEFVWLEDLIKLAEESGSAPVYSLLKREDEKFVTEMAYDNPAFVEDVARNLALKLNKIKEIEWYRIEVEALESIHNHNAFAVVEKC